MSEVSKLRKTADKICAKMSQMQSLTDSELKGKTDEFRMRLKNGETLDQILVDAYAVVGEASYRAIGLRPYPVQFMGATALHHGKVVEQNTGEGKAVTVDTLIPTPNGWKLADEIKIGDIIFSKNGKPTKVLGVYPQGEKQIYEVHLADGRVVETADEHLWSVYAAGSQNKMMTLNTIDMYNKGLKSGKAFRYRLPLNDAVEYKEVKLPVDPYVLGVYIGMRSKSEYMKFPSKYATIAENIALVLDIDGDISKYKWSEVIPSLNDLFSDNDVYIPDAYAISSIEQRWAIVQGLFDVKGSIENSGSFRLSFSTESSKLCDELMDIIYSLGMSCCKKESNGEYVVYVSIEHKNKIKFFRYDEAKLKKASKAASEGSTRTIYDRVAITDIVKREDKIDMVCFTVDDPSHLFLCGSYVVTHNTLVAAMPAYLNALEGKGVHVVTVNDYLAERDATEIGKIHNFLGLTVGCISKNSSPQQKQKEYAKDITYITNTELGFDYLRDNMARRAEDRMQRGYHYCIIDEVDSVLIDEARTPLIISGVGGKSNKLYIACNELVRVLEKGESKELSKVELIAGERPEETGDYVVDEEHHSVSLTLAGIKKCEDYFGIDNLSETKNTELLHNIIAALKAHNLMKKDKDYVVKNGEVMIVDSFTGRIMPGRRYSDGLHQAIEAKEGVEIKGESQTEATVTYQNFFNKYEKKCGMTGTAYTERKEFKEIYHMNVVRIPTNKPRIREDKHDKMFLDKNEKFMAVVDEVKKAHEKGQPVLVGTATIGDSEILDKMMTNEGLPHTVLNAKFHEKEAEIIAKAGTYGSITIATNMAGRGTDIKLDDESREAGGLKVIGTQRHESRRIDNQLKGRSGRQGDPGESVFFLSLDDEVLRLYGPEGMKNALKVLGMKSNESIENKTVNSFVNKAQTMIEDNNFGARKNVLKFDKVNNEQRELIYSERNAILDKADMRKTSLCMIEDSICMIIDKYSNKKYVQKNEYDGIKKEIEVLIHGIESPEFEEKEKKRKLADRFIEAANKKYCEREQEWPDINSFREFERNVILSSIDVKWMEHINDLEVLRQNIALIGYGQKDPAVVYKLKAFDMFEKMSDDIKQDAVYTLFSTLVKPGA